LTVSAGASSASTVTITLNGTANTVSVTNANNIQRLVWELASATYTGWKAVPASSTTVMFLKDAVGPTVGVFSYGAGTTGSAATLAQTLTGAAATETFVAQADWNGDCMCADDNNGMVADWTKGNVFQIGMQYLGFGTITFSVERVNTDSNNSTWVTVHTLKLPNSLTTTSVRNPSFPFTAAVYSAGSTTDLSLRLGSFAGFVEGARVLHGNRYSYLNQTNAVTDSAIRCLFTILNQRTFGGISNQSTINIISVAAAIKHTNPVSIYVIKNGTLAGNPSFSSPSSASCALMDTAATTITYTGGEQLVWTGHLGDTGQLEHIFLRELEEFTLQPGEYLTVAAKSIQSNVAWVVASMNTREDQ
jgi:hypothetical protein